MRTFNGSKLNLVSHAKGGTQTEGVLLEQAAEENIWIEEGGSGGRLQKTA
jgi:hypothetical protein